MEPLYRDFTVCKNCGGTCYLGNDYCEDCANELFEAECGCHKDYVDVMEENTLLKKALELACDDIWAMSIWENTKEEVIEDSIKFYKQKAKEMMKVSKEYVLQFNLNNYISAEEPHAKDLGAVIVGKVNDDSGILKVLFDSHKEDTVNFFIELIKYVSDLETKLTEKDEALKLAREYMFNVMCADDVPSVEWFIKCAKESQNDRK